MWKQIAIIALIVIVGIGIYEAVLPRISDYATECMNYYDSMYKQDYQLQLLQYIDNTLRDPITGLNYTQLVAWEHKYLKHIPTNDSSLTDRRSMPIDILNRIGDGTYRTSPTQKSMGRCGEFALLYTGLCIANGYMVKLIVDDSSWINQSKTGGAGDHVWDEVFDVNADYWVNGAHFIEKWVHVDPTEARFDDPKMYVRDWNKDVNLVYAISVDYSTGQIVSNDITAKYQ
jgi:hypothetical protein